MEICFVPENPAIAPINYTINNFSGPGVALAMYNTDKSITDFAHSSFKYALERALPLYMRLLGDPIKKYYSEKFIGVF